MNQKSFASLVLIGALVVLIGLSSYFSWSKKSQEPNNQQISFKLTLDILQNAEYDFGGQNIKLVDGTYPLEPLAGESQADYFIKLDTDHVVFGDLNGDGQEDAGVILVSRAGGTGTFRELVAVLNQNGNPVDVANEYLGDRTVINSLVIQNGVISLNRTPWNDGSNKPETVQYKLVGNKLVQNSTIVSLNDTSGWKIYKNDEYRFEFKFPSNYTLLENTDFDVRNKIMKLEVALDDLTSNNERPFFELLIKDAKLNSLSSELAWFKKSFNNVVINHKKIGDNSFTIMSYDNSTGVGRNETYYVEHGNFLYVFNYLPDIKDILDTFKFTK